MEYKLDLKNNFIVVGKEKRDKKERGNAKEINLIFNRCRG